MNDILTPAQALELAQKSNEISRRTGLRKIGPRPYYTGTPVFIDGRPTDAGTPLPRGVEQSPFYTPGYAGEGSRSTTQRSASSVAPWAGAINISPDLLARVRAQQDALAQQKRDERLEQLNASQGDPYRYGRDPNTPEGPRSGPVAPRTPSTRRYGHGKRFEFKRKPEGKQEGGVMQAQPAAGAPPEGGLTQMLAESGAPKNLLKETERIESMPGGRELLFTIAGEEMMKSQGATNEQAKKLRLYNLGDEKAFASGGEVEGDQGLTGMADIVREGGRGDDEVLLHMSPEEFEALTAMWGSPDKNPVTGLPEYGFLSKVWKKIKKGVKKVVKSKWFQVLAPIALSIFVPGIGAAIGAALTGGGTGLAASAIGNAVVNGALGAASGGKEGFIKGAISGAVGAGGLGKAAGQAAGLTGTAADIAGSAVLQGAGSAATGDGFASGAISGGLGAAFRPAQEKIVGNTREGLGLTEKTTLNPVTGEKIAVGDDPGLQTQRDAGITGQSDPSEIGIAEASPVGSAATGDPTATAAAGATTPASDGKLLDTAMKYGIPLATAFGGQGAGPDVYEQEPDWWNRNTDEALPDYALNRGQAQSPTDYFTYGQRRAPQGGGEQQFFNNNSGARPTDATGQNPMSAAGMDPQQAQQLQAAGWTLIAGTWYPPGAGPGQGSAAPQGGGRAPVQTPQYNIDPYAAPPQGKARGGFATQGEEDYYRQNMDALRVASREGGHMYRGKGSGRDDNIEAMLSDGEYVMDAETVSMLGDGSTDEGARRLDEMRVKLRKHKGRNLNKGKFSHDAKRPEQYLAEGGKAAKIKALFEIYDHRTGETVGTAKTKKGARRSRDRRDNQHGSYRYGVREAGSDTGKKKVKKAHGGVHNARRGGNVDEVLNIMMEEIA